VTALMMERGYSQIVGMVGVLQSTSTMLTLEVTWPHDRLSLLLQDSQAAALIVQRKFVDRVPSSFGGILIVVGERDGGKHTLEREHADAKATLETIIEGDEHILYLQYTSGSSGVPKAVLCGERAVMARAVGYNACFPIGPQDKFLVKSAYTFGLFEMEILWTLQFGGTMVLLKAGDEVDPKRINSALINHVVTHVVLPTSPCLACLAVIGQYAFSKASSLRNLIECGEKLTWQCVQEASKMASPATTLYNLYGASESSLAFWEAPKDSALIEQAVANRDPVPAGEPIAMTAWNVLGFETLERVADGEQGEICCSGPVGSGYLNNAEATANAFVPDPFGLGERMYRTGDVGKIEGKNLVVLGRRDRQVKVNGKRIELDEVENSIRLGAAKVGLMLERAAAVIGEKQGGTALVAYVAPQDIDIAALKDAMGTVGPKWLVPSVIVSMEKLPQLSSGKVDYVTLKGRGSSDLKEAMLDVGDVPLSGPPPGMSIATFLSSKEGKALQAKGIDSIGLVRMFRENEDEVRTRDNLYALSMTMVVIFHSLSLLSSNGAPFSKPAYEKIGQSKADDADHFGWTFLLGEDCMTVWLVFQGWAEGKKRRTGRVWFDLSDLTLFELWVMMRYLLPVVLVPIVKFVQTRLCVDSATCGFPMYTWWRGGENEFLYPHWEYPSWWLGPHTDGVGKGWITNEDGIPSFPAWFLIWLVIAKFHAVLLSALRIPPPVQILLLLATGFFACDQCWGWKWGAEYPWGPDGAKWLRCPIVYDLFGQALWFYSLEKSTYLAIYVGSIYYADPVIKRCLELGKSQTNVVIACVALVFLLEVHFFTTPIRDTTSTMQEWATRPRWVMDVEAGYSAFMFFANGWQGKESQHPKAYQNMWAFVKVRGFDFVWNLFLWPTVTALKAVIFRGAPFHLQVVGTTTLGAYIIHPYVAIWTPQAYNSIMRVLWSDVFGDVAAKLVFFIMVVVYALLIQYVLGTAVHKIFIAVIIKFHGLCRWLYTSVEARLTAHNVQHNSKAYTHL